MSCLHKHGLPAHITTEPCDEFTHEDDYKLTEHLYQGRSKLRSNRQKRTPLSDPSQLPKAFVDCIPTMRMRGSAVKDVGLSKAV